VRLQRVFPLLLPDISQKKLVGFGRKRGIIQVYLQPYRGKKTPGTRPRQNKKTPGTRPGEFNREVKEMCALQHRLHENN